jgi:hypothetical protein
MLDQDFVMRNHKLRKCLKGHCCVDGSPGVGEGGGMKRNRRSRPRVQSSSALAAFRVPPHVILLAVRWYLRYGLSYRVRSLIHERGIDVDHVTLFRWVQRFTLELIDATYVKVNGVWR